MSHTTEQASTLWCPMARTARREDTHPDMGGLVVVSGCNTDALGGVRVPASCRCIADKCAMWRWSTYDAPPDGAEPGKLYVAVKKRAGTGYCGLAGRPEVQP